MLGWRVQGIDTNGVLRVPWYAELLGRGDLNPKARLEIVRAVAVAVLIESDHGPVPAATLFAMDEVSARPHAGSC